MSKAPARKPTTAESESAQTASAVLSEIRVHLSTLRRLGLTVDEIREAVDRLLVIVAREPVDLENNDARLARIRAQYESRSIHDLAGPDIEWTLRRAAVANRLERNGGR